MSSSGQIVKHNSQVDNVAKILKGQIAIAIPQSANSFQETKVCAMCDWRNNKFVATNTVLDSKQFNLETWESLPVRVTNNFSEFEIAQITEEIAARAKNYLVKLLSSKRASGVSTLTLFVKQGRLTGITLEESQPVPQGTYSA